MSLYRRFIHTGRVADCVATVFLALWTSVSILWAEVVGFPALYGWPLRVVRLPDSDHPHAWVWVVDLLAACLALSSTWVVAIWNCRARMKGFQFRLATLLSAAATIAVVAAVWRWSSDHLMFAVAKFGDQDKDFATIATLDVTAFMAWLPAWIEPRPIVGLLVRGGVVTALGCTIYVAGRLLAALARRRTTMRR